MHLTKSIILATTLLMAAVSAAPNPAPRTRHGKHRPKTEVEGIPYKPIGPTSVLWPANSNGKNVLCDKRCANSVACLYKCEDDECMCEGEKTTVDLWPCGGGKPCA